ncbi:MAG: NIPSNAP family protein [Proteobacteria bacterium]|nr:NIPSNAP family protein [Pseudomonadota bacterium]
MMFDKPLVDLRVYTIRLRKMGAFIDVFDRLAMPVQVKYLGLPLGMYVSAVGELNQLVHLWGFDDMGAFERCHAARDRDPDWPAYLAASADLITAQENRLIRRVEMPLTAALIASGAPIATGAGL